MSRLNILGVRIDNLSQDETLEKISSFLNDGKYHQIATVNPEFILEAQKNEEFRNILNVCDLNVADSIGIKLAFWRYGKNLKNRTAGVDLMLEILHLAEDRRVSVFLACRKDGLSSFQETKIALLKIFPNLLIDGDDIDVIICHFEPRLGREESKKNNDKIRSLGIARDDKNKPKIIFANFGAPDQEIFINSLKNEFFSLGNRSKLQNNNLYLESVENNELRNEMCGGIIGLGLGVGGSFDFITGKIKRAPLWMRKIGMEWIFRLYQQPNRWKRIWNAVIVFPIKIIFHK